MNESKGDFNFESGLENELQQWFRRVKKGSADLYSFLDLQRFESNVDLIKKHASQRIQFADTWVRQNKGDARADKLIKAIKSAAKKLLKPELKSAYDKKLRQKQTTSPQPDSTRKSKKAKSITSKPLISKTPRASQKPSGLVDLSTNRKRRSSEASKVSAKAKTKNPYLLPAIISGGVIVALAGILLVGILLYWMPASDAVEEARMPSATGVATNDAPEVAVNVPPKEASSSISPSTELKTAKPKTEKPKTAKTIQPRTPGPGPSEVEPFSLPGVSKKFSPVDIALDETGAVYTIADNKFFVRQEDGFRELPKEKISTAKVLTRFYGGYDRPLCLIGRSAGSKRKLYRLTAEGVSEMTDFDFLKDADRPGIFITKDGRILNWGDKFLNVFDGQNWNEKEVNFDGSRLIKSPPVVVELGLKIYLYQAGTKQYYVVDDNGQIESLEIPDSLFAKFGKYSTAFSVGNKILFTKTRRILLGLDVITGEEIDFETLNIQLRPHGYRILDIIAKKDGNFWLIPDLTTSSTVPRASDVPKDSERQIWEVNPDQEVRRFAVNALPKWNNLKRSEKKDPTNKKLVTECIDGTMVFARQVGGPVIIRNQKVEEWGLPEGFLRGPSSFVVAPNGEFWLTGGVVGANLAKVFVNDLPPEAANQKALENWEEIPIVERGPLMQVDENSVAMFREDKSEALSRFEDGKWIYQQLPFKVKNFSKSAIDDRGHIWVSFKKSYADIGRESVRTASSWKELLEGITQTNARTFRCSEHLPGVVRNDDKLWTMLDDRRGVNMFDGKSWTVFKIRRRYEQFLFASEKYGFALETRWGTYYSYDSDLATLKELEELRKITKRMFIGIHPQPFEEELAGFKPSDGYFTAIRQGNSLAFSAGEDTFEFENGSKVTASELPVGGKRWFFESYKKCFAIRVTENQIERFDFYNTPIYGKPITSIAETSDGELWIRTWHENRSQLFHFTGEIETLIQK